MNNKMRKWSIRAGIILPVLLILGLATATQWSALRSQTNTNPPNGAQGQNRKLSKLDMETVPLVDYDGSQTNDPERQSKNHRHGGVSGFVEKAYRGEESVLINDWEVGLPALPVDRSDSVVLGKVVGAQAFLSDDKSGIYSEFKVLVDNVLKGDALLTPGSSIVAERLGGRVRLPSGRTVVYRLIGQAFPQLNGTYVFFLKKENGQADYSILTAYELKGGRIIPLDGSNVELTSTWRFDKYKDVDEQQFLGELRDAIAKSSKSSKSSPSIQGKGQNVP